MVLCHEHTKFDKNPSLIALRESLSIPNFIIWDLPEQKTVISLYFFGAHSIGYAREIQQTIQAFKLKKTLKLHVESIHVHNFF